MCVLLLNVIVFEDFHEILINFRDLEKFSSFLVYVDFYLIKLLSIYIPTKSFFAGQLTIGCIDADCSGADR